VQAARCSACKKVLKKVFAVSKKTQFRQLNWWIATALVPVAEVV
jgi:hypothetical protein